MKIIITGGAGFIGSNLAKSFTKYDEIHVIDNLSSGLKKNISNTNLNFIEADISIKAEWCEIFTYADQVYHLAALADIVPSIEKPNSYFESNVTGTINVMESIRKYCPKASIVYSASSSCYGIPSNFPTSENEKISNEYPYALTKFLGEKIVLHWSKVYNLKASSCRLFNVYGNYSRTSGAYGAMFAVFLGQIFNKLPLTVVGDGNQKRDFTHVHDVVRALKLVCKKNLAGEIFNVGSGNPTSVNEIIKLMNYDNIIYIPKRPGEPDLTHANIDKIKKTIGWTPEISIQDGVSSLLKNINLFKDVPAWTPEKIKLATKDWFHYLGKKN